MNLFRFKKIDFKYYLIQLLIGLGAAFFVQVVYANPVLDHVASGDVSIQQTTNNTVVNQTSQKAIINWQSFNIDQGQSTHFQQVQGGVALNRISPTQGASQIYGALTATGQIILVNPAGIHFGSSAYVNVGGLIATTSNISDTNFNNGHYFFDQVSSYPNASIINEGILIAAQHGLIALVGQNVTNTGMIVANMGQVALASGGAFTVDFAGDQLINFSTSDGRTGKVVNTGSLIANGGKVLITAQKAADILDNVINLSGMIQAKSVYEQDGEIVISGDPNAGIVSVAANIDATGDAGLRGGQVNITGHNILLDSPSLINVSGDAGGGVINIGGNYQGNGPLPHANALVMLEGSRLLADGIIQGNGGQIVLWSDNMTKAYGDISARGGLESGDGGVIETSSKNYLDVNGISIDTRAINGNKGTWLLDPSDIYIASSLGNAQSAGMSGSDNSASNPQTISPGNTMFSSSGADESWLDTATLTTSLASTNVLVTTTSAGTASGNITVVDPISWSADTNLFLTADNNININSGGTISWTGNGSLNLTAGGTIGINAAITTGTSSSQLNLTAPGNITQTAAIGGSGSVRKSGAGTLIFSEANSYTGITVLNQGTIQLAQSNVLPSTSVIFSAGTTLELSNNVSDTIGFLQSGTSTSTVSLGSNSTLTILCPAGGGCAASYNGRITGSGNLAVTGNAFQTLTRTDNTYTGTTTINNGGLTIAGDGSLGTAPVSATPGSIVLSSGTLTGSTGFTLNANRGISLTNSNTINLSGSLIYDGIIAGTGSLNITSSLLANTLQLGGNNTYSGSTNILGGTLQIGSGGTSGSIASATIGNDSALVFNRSDALTFSNTINGIGTVTQAGTGTTTLSGSNSYSGGTTVNAGVLDVTNANGLGTSGAITVNSGSRLNINLGGDVLANTSTMTLNGSGPGGTSHALSKSGGTVDEIDNPIILGSAATIGSTGGSFLIDGNINNAGFDLTFNHSFGNILIDPTVSISGAGSLNVTGSGGGLRLFGANSYTGSTNIGAGTFLQFDNIGSLGTASGGPINISSGGSLSVAVSCFSSCNLLNTSLITLSGSGSTGGAISGGGNNIVLTNPIVMTDNTTFQGPFSASSYSLNGQISGAFNITIASGNLSFGGANTYSGLTQVNSNATLSLASSGALGNTTGVTVASGGTLNINNTSLTNTNGISIVGTGVSSVGALTFTGASSTLSNAITLTGATSMGGSGSGVLSGTISGAQALTKVGAGTITLAGASNASTTTTISAGTLQIGNGGTIGTLGSGNVTNNATLSFNRSNALTVSNVIGGTGILTQAGSGTLTLSATNTYSGGTIVNAGTLSISNDNNLGATTGSLTLNGGTLFSSGSAITMGASRNIILGASGGTFNIASGFIDVNGSVSGSGSFTKLGNGTTDWFGSNSYSGATLINGGAFGAFHVNALGNTTSTTVASGATLYIGNLGGSLTNTNDITINGLGLSGGGALQATGTASLSNRIILGSDSNITAASAGNLTLNGVISGPFNVTIGMSGGPFTTPIRFAANNTYTGTTTISSNTLYIGNGGASGTFGAGNVTNNAALVFNRTDSSLNVSNVISGTGTVTQAGSGTTTLSGANTYSGGTSINSGTISIASLPNGATSPLGASNISFNGGTLLYTGAADTSSNRSITLNSGGGTFNTSNAIILTLAGIVSGSGSLNTLGNGTLELSGSNTGFTGAVNIQGSALRISDINAIGNASNTAGITIGTASTLEYDVPTNLSTLGNASTITIQGPTRTGVAFSSLSIDGFFNNPIVLQGDATFQKTTDVGFNQTNFNGIISESGGSYGVIITGAGRDPIAFNAANTFTGNITINSGGSLVAGNSQAFGSNPASSITVNNGGITGVSSSDLNLFGRTLSVTGFGQGGFGSIVGLGTGGTINNGTINLTGSTRFSALPSAPLTIAAAITGTGDIGLIGFADMTFSNSANNFVGNLTLYSTTLNVAANNAIPATSAIIFEQILLADSILNLNGFNDTIAGLRSGTNNGVVQTGGGNLTIGDASTLYTFNGAINGTGSLTKTGANTQILAWNNTYTGTTTISDGVLQIGNGGTNGTLGSGNVTNNATLSFNRTDTYTVGNVISGTGNLTQSGSGTMILTGANSYDTTTISAGILQIGNGGTTGTLGSGNVTNNATLSFNRTDTYTVDNVISGTGNLTQSGSGTTILTGANSYGTTTISAGTLQIGNGGTTGTLGSGNVTNNAALLFNRTNSYTVSNAISGPGSLTQSGSGTTILTGANSYDTTTISSGTLQVGNGGTNGTLGSGTLFTSGGILAFNRSDGYALSNLLSGNGEIDQNGGGILTISNNNIAFSGTLNANAGDITVTNGGALGTSTVSINNNNTLNISGVSVGDAAIILNDGTLNTTGIASLGSAPGTNAVTINNSGIINVASGSFSVNSSIDGTSANADSLTLQGSGALTLNSNIGNGIALGTLSADIALGLGANLGMSANTIQLNQGINGVGFNLGLTGSNIQVQGALALKDFTINGTGGSNFFALNTGNVQTWSIFASDNGNFATSGLTGTGTFNTIQNLIGGDNNDEFIFTTDSGAITGSLDGGSLANPAVHNTLNYQAVSSTNITLTANKFNGSSSNIASYSNIDNLIGDTNNHSILFANNATQLADAVITDRALGQGFMGDPLTWSGFTLVGIPEPIPPAPSTVDGGIVSPIIVQPEANHSGSESTISTTSYSVEGNIDLILAETQEWYDANIEKVKINPYCGNNGPF